MMRWALPVAVAIGLVAALLTWTRAGSAAPSPGEPVVVYLLDNGFHTDLAVPRAALERRGGPLALAVRSLGPGDWILIGWGDAIFYVDQRPIADRLPDGARAFFRPGNPAVLMLDPEGRAPSALQPQNRRAALALSPGDFERMADRVEGSLNLATGAPRIIAARPGDDARFFASRQTFSILHLCNHWTADVLNAGGVTIRPARSVFSGEVMRATRSAEQARKLDIASPRA